MAAATLSTRMPRRARRGTSIDQLRVGLAFDQTPAGLVAVCGLGGGVGASTIAWLLARQAARESRAPILLCETDSASGGLAALTGVETTLTLAELALHIREGTRPDGPVVASASNGLRVIAAPPRAAGSGGDADVLCVLEDARAVHGLVVVDAGSLTHPASASALAAASDVLWVADACVRGVQRAAKLWASALASPRGPARETLVAVNTRPASPASPSDLRGIARTRAQRLVLVPHIPQFAAGEDVDNEQLAHALTALAVALRPSR